MSSFVELNYLVLIFLVSAYDVTCSRTFLLINFPIHAFMAIRVIGSCYIS